MPGRAAAHSVYGQGRGLEHATIASVDELVKALGMTGISESQVSRLCEEIEERVRTFLERPIAVARVFRANWQRCRVDFHAQRVRPCRQERPGAWSPPSLPPPSPNGLMQTRIHKGR